MTLTGTEFTAILIGFGVILGSSWCTTFFCLRNNTEAFTVLFADGWVLKIIAVIFIVLTAGMLAVIGKEEGNQLITLFSGIGGYVLGSMQTRPKTFQKLPKQPRGDQFPRDGRPHTETSRPVP